MNDAASHSPYRPEIDGLRAISILAVVLHHFHVPMFGGGFVGVDVFFVISGYLITRIVVAEIEDGTFSFVRFYERRARRLLPTLTVVLAAVFLAALAIMTPQDMQEVSKSIVYALAFVANLYFAEQGGYFSPSLDAAPLLHTWSLAVEEQFYLAWPILCLLIHRVAPRRMLAAALALLGVSFAVSVVILAREPVAAFYYPHTRFWELLAGCVLALAVPAPRRAVTASVAGLLGLALIAISVVTYDDVMPFPGAAALVPVLGAALVIWSGGAATHGLAARALSWRPLVFVGLVSYAWYLWHWPLLVLYRYGAEREPTALEAGLLIAASFALAVLSWRYLEQPVRRGLWWKPRPFAVKTAAAAVAGLAIMAGAGYASQGFIAHYPAPMRDLTRKALTVRAKDRPCPRPSAERIAAGELCTVWDGGPAALAILLWGDSHASVLRPVLRDLAEATGTTVAFVGMPACPPLIGVGRNRHALAAADLCADLNEAVAKRLRSGGFRDVILAARWNYYATGAAGRHAAAEQHYLRDRETRAASLAENQAVLARNLAPTVAAITASGARAWLVMEAPFAGYDVPNRIARAMRRGDEPQTLETLESRTQSRRAAVMRTLVVDLPLRLIDPAEVLCDASRCRAAVKARPLYFDDNHLSVDGALTLAPLFAPVFARE